MAKARYTKPASQVDLEERQKEGYVPSTVLDQGGDAEVSDNGYIGVDPAYQTYANETEAPLSGTKGPESKIVKNFVAEDADHKKAATPAGKSVEKEEGQSSGSGSSTPPSSSTPPTGSK